MKEISIILPAYNEKDNIKEAISSAYNYVRRRFNNYEIVVVSDGGTDGTKDVVMRLAKTRKWLKLIDHEKNQGYGATLRTGFGCCKGELIFYTDSDNQYDFSDLDLLLPLINKYDIVAGYREVRQDPLSRIFVAWVYNLIIRLALGLKIRDVDCSFKLYDRKIFDRIKLRANTGLIDAEILIKAKKKGFTVGQVAVKHFPRIKGQTIYEIGKRNKVFAFVDPRVPLAIFKEMRILWNELR